MKIEEIEEKEPQIKASVKPKKIEKPQEQKQEKVVKKEATTEHLPSVDLLKIKEKTLHKIDYKQQQENLIKVLKDFNLDIVINSVQIGPVVTLYSVEIPAGVKASKIINLADDIARLMETFSARISSIPGKNLIGIELANEKRQTIYFKEGMEQFKENELILPMYLGCNIFGKHEFYDLAKMPHLLVAGTTGSGKSVGIHSMLLSLLMKKSYNEVKLILIDPKKLELIAYENLPHLLFPIVTESKEAIKVMQWVVEEMERRYRLLSKNNFRGIAMYNEANEEKMDYIVVVIDELADLMLLTGKEFEICIQRLAQMGRACGIHLILATQRPSVDVITGTIKANFPTRISFKLASKLDSRIILSEAGAQSLLGMGDMLYLGIDGQLKRIHGSFVFETDVANVVNFWKEKNQPTYIELEEQTTLLDGDFDDISNDPFFEEAKKLIKENQKVSASFLQRNLPIGFNKAAAIIEKMEKDGLISKGDSFGRNREILF